MCTHSLSLSLSLSRTKAAGTRTPTRHPQIGPLWPAVQLNRPILTLTHIEVLRSELSILLIGRRGLRARALSLSTRAHSASRLLRVQRISQFAHGTPAVFWPFKRLLCQRSRARLRDALSSRRFTAPYRTSVAQALSQTSLVLRALVRHRPCSRCRSS